MPNPAEINIESGLGVPGFNGFFGDGNLGGMLGTIKDEDSNADSDFSGDDGTPSNLQFKLDPA